MLQGMTVLEAVEKGMSGDEKYRVKLRDGRECLLRLSEKEREERKKAEFRLMENAFRLGIPVSEPYAFGEYDGKAYQLAEWLAGSDLEQMELSGEAGHTLGEKAAALLKSFHAVPAPENISPWEERFREKIRVRAEEAEELFGERADIARLCRYLRERLTLLKGLEQRLNHGDYNAGNLILRPDGSLTAVDLNAYNGGYGEPVFETAVILFDEKLPEDFRKGFRDGYFGADAPEELLDYYLGYGLLAGLCEADESEQGEILRRIGDFIERKEICLEEAP